MTFRDPPGPLDLPSTLAPGARLQVALQGFDDELFSGEVTAVEFVYTAAQGRELYVRGYDRLHRLRKRQTTGAHVQVTPGSLARDLTADLGISVTGGEDSPLWLKLIQHYPNDFALLVYVTEQAGLYFTLYQDILHLLTLEGAGSPLLLEWGKSLFETRIEVNGERSCRTVTANGWNPLRVEVAQGEASRPRLGRRVAAEIPPDRLGGNVQRRLLDETVQNDQHAQALAQAELDRRAAQEVTLWGMAEGSPRLRPGVRLLVKGVAAQLEGQYVLGSVTHTVDGMKGYTSELSSAPPAAHDLFRGATAVLGVVTSVMDPQNLGRARVRLPTFKDVETEWMAVLSPGAGKDKGLVALPSVDDQVLVILLEGDPGQGIILGGLFGMLGAPDNGVAGDAVRRYTFRTSGGQIIRLDDEHQGIHVQDSNGSYIDLGPEKVLLHAAVRLEIEAPGNEVVVSGGLIDFKKA